MVTTDKMLASVLSEIEELRAERVDAQDRIKYITKRLGRLGRIVHMLDEEGLVDEDRPKRARTTHSTDFKIKAVRFIHEHPDWTWKDLGKKFGVTGTTIREWASDERFQ